MTIGTSRLAILVNGVHLEESLKVLELQLEDTEGAESVIRLS